MSDTNTVQFKSNRGSTYTVPAKYKSAVSVSDLIRRMAKDGMSRGQISKATGIRYQHVRNVLVTPLIK